MDTNDDGIIIDISTDQFHIDHNKIQRLANSLCHHMGLVGFELSLSFVEAEAMASLNHQYRQKEHSTDVLSFPQWEWPAPRLLGSHQEVPTLPAWEGRSLGDIVISLEDAWANAQKIGQGLDRETCFLLVHGLLHLCGHDHEQPDEEALMIEQQKQLMALLEEDSSSPLWLDCVQLKTEQK